ncbi:hypothetical protein VTH82DRAFT_4158 [Thermothelomyces myriococcoides]
MAEKIEELLSNISKHFRKHRKARGREGSTIPNNSTHTSADKVASSSVAAKLWDLAYDELKREETKLVTVYEQILSGQLKHGHGSKVSESQPNLIDQNNPDMRREQMRQLINDGLAKIDREIQVKENLIPALNLALSVKNVIRTAVHMVPAAALACGGISVALQVCFRRKVMPS